jgi:hypothetical protein
MGESHLEILRRTIQQQYEAQPTSCGGVLGNYFATNGLSFVWLAEKWGWGLTLGELIWDHCKRLEKEPSVTHNYNASR